jgi:AMIN domain
MKRSLRAAAGLLLGATLWLPAPAAGQALPSIRRVQVLRTRGQVEIEIEATDRIVPRTNVITGPDRLIVDFVNALPGAQLRNQAVNRAEVKSLRVGLFSSNPPVTRVVLDLNGPQAYQVFPSGRTVIVKIGEGGAETANDRSGSGPALVNTNYPASAAHLSVATPAPPKPALLVSFQGGLLSINSSKANLSEVLFAVHQQTGAEIAIPAGAEQEQVVADLGPAPAPEVLAHLLNGSRFNFLILSSATDPHALDRVILSSRPEGPMPTSRPQPRVVAEEDEDSDIQPKVAQPPVRAVPSPQAENQNPSSPADRQTQPGAAVPPDDTRPAPGDADIQN